MYIILIYESDASADFNWKSGQTLNQKSGQTGKSKWGFQKLKTLSDRNQGKNFFFCPPKLYFGSKQHSWLLITRWIKQWKWIKSHANNKTGEVWGWTWSLSQISRFKTKFFLNLELPVLPRSFSAADCCITEKNRRRKNYFLKIASSENEGKKDVCRWRGKIVGCR